MLAAEEVFSETFGRFMLNWSFVMSLRQVSEVALPIAEKALTLMHAEAVEAIATDPDYNKIIVKLDGSPSSWGDELKQLIRAGMTETAISNARKAVDAASLVFAQSMLDDSAWSYCRVCALIAPHDWEPFLEAKKVDFATLSSRSDEAIRDELIQAMLSQLERESLLKKVDMLFRVCNPPEGYAPIDNYVFDRKRLDTIDNQRHRIIHANGLKDQLNNDDDDLAYVVKTSNYLMGLVNQKYGVRIHPLQSVSPASHALCRLLSSPII
jgi:hypothetical protein